MLRKSETVSKAYNFLEVIPMKGIKRLADKKYFMTIVWIFLIIAVWEVFAFIVGATKRTPENILPYLGIEKQ